MDMSNRTIIAFESDEHRLEKLKEWELVTPNSEELQPTFKYKGVFRSAAAECKVIGYEDKHTIIIEFEDGQQSAIHRDYLKMMQKKTFKTGLEESTEIENGEENEPQEVLLESKQTVENKNEYEDKFKSLFAGIANPSQIKTNISMFVKKNVIFKEGTYIAHKPKDLNELDRLTLSKQFIEAEAAKKRVYTPQEGYSEDQLLQDVAQYIDLSIAKMYNKLEYNLDTYSVMETKLEFQYPNSEGMASYLDARNNMYSRKART